MYDIYKQIYLLVQKNILILYVSRDNGTQVTLRVLQTIRSSERHQETPDSSHFDEMSHSVHVSKSKLEAEETQVYPQAPGSKILVSWKAVVWRRIGHCCLGADWFENAERNVPNCVKSMPVD